MPVRFRVTSVTVRPPMTAVSPSLTSSRLVAICLAKLKPRSAAARACTADRSVREVHQDLPVVGHVRRDRQPDAGLPELHRRAGRSALPGLRRAGVNDPDRRFLADQDVGLVVVQGGDGRLGLDVGQVHPLERAQEGGEAEPADAPWRRPGREPSPVMIASALAMPATVLPPRSTTFTALVEGVAGGGVGPLDDLVEELAPAAQVVLATRAAAGRSGPRR